MVGPDGKPLRGTMKPYQVKGVWYVPREQPNYNETGIASWYGQQFHNKSTANGEVFDQWRVSAAHKTLPLPSMVEVRNLDNGRTLKVRVNDRGPFVDGRIIDLSRAAAEELGFAGKGVAKVRVRYLGPAGKPDGYRVAARPGGVWRVQAGTFSSRTNAERLVEQLAGAGPASIEEVELGGAPFYRVLLGAFADEREADALRRRVAAIVPDARVLRPF